MKKAYQTCQEGRGHWQTTDNKTEKLITPSKLNPSGSALIWSTYLGSANTENGYDIAVNSSGEAYVVGSSAPLFGLRDAFIHKLSADGAGLKWSKSFGGTN